MISPHAVDDLSGLLRERIQGAIGYRERVVRDTDAYRVIFSEADFLPGLIVDRYNDCFPSRCSPRPWTRNRSAASSSPNSASA